MENSLKIYNAASSPPTIVIMTIIAVFDLPFVITYTAIVYRNGTGFHMKLRKERS